MSEDATGSPPPLALQPPPPRTPGQPLAVEAHWRRQRRASDVIDSGGPSPGTSAGSPGALGAFPPPPSPRSPLRSPASDRGYASGGAAFASPLSPVARDATDAAPAGAAYSAEEDVFVGVVPVPEASMPVDKDAHEYNMGHPRRGRFIIFNHEEFEETTGMGPRLGSDVDVKNLEGAFSALGFEVTVHHNLRFAEIRSTVEGLAAEDHGDADCLVLAVLTHGIANGFLLARDTPYPVHLLWQPFTADRCRTLAGKPKLFFIQACRGERLDHGVSLVRGRSRTQTDSGPAAYRIPSHADFLLAFSAAEGFFSWRNPEQGTWFVQCLCRELAERAHNTDLLSLLTRVSRRVALDYESFNDMVPWQSQCKQVPTVNSLLIRDLVFRPKE